jgi:UDP-N-acetylglucosamine 2-epimerase (non-hydrolysing)
MKNKKIKVLFVFGTRPEAIKMAPVIKKFQQNKKKFDVSICATAQHREMLDQVLRLFDIRPHHDLNIMTERQSLSKLAAAMLLRVTTVMEKEKPDIVFIQGDTSTTFAAAQAAYYLKIPIAHIEAGLRTNKKYSPFPEEINRRLTSVIADLHFAPTGKAKENLKREGFLGSSVYVTGNTVIDALMAVVRVQKEKGRKKDMEKYFLKKWNLTLCKQYGNPKLILVTGHRRESFGKGFNRICKALSILAKKNQDVQIVYPVHLNPNVQEPVYSVLGGINNVHLISPLDYGPFVFLMNQADLILTDSGGIQEEAPSLDVPVLVMRETSERPEGIKAGLARLVGTNVETIVAETQKILDNGNKRGTISGITNPYGDGKASERIVKVILKYFRRQG